MKSAMLNYLFLGLLSILFSSFLHTPTQSDHAIIKSHLSMSSAGGSQESNSVLYLTTYNVKLIMESDVVKTWLFYDSLKRTITVLTKTLGKSLGLQTPYNPNYMDSAVSINYIDSTKTINGFQVKKAIIIDSTRQQNDVVVWYSPKYSFSNETMGINLKGLHRLKGLPIQFYTQAGSISLNYLVTTIDVTSPIPSTEFEIPKGFDISTNYDDYKAKMSKAN